MRSVLMIYTLRFLKIGQMKPIFATAAAAVLENYMALERDTYLRMKPTGDSQILNHSAAQIPNHRFPDYE